LYAAHAVYGALEMAKTMKKGEDIVICLSGRGDKDVQSVADELPKFGPMIGWDLRFSIYGKCRTTRGLSYPGAQ
jgi:tryptophan synthase